MNRQMISQLLNQLGPIGQFAIRLKTGIANPGPVGRNNSHAELARGRVGQLRHRSRAWPAMEKHHRRSRGATVLGISEIISAFEPEHLALVHQAPIISETGLEENPLSRQTFAL